MGNTIEARRNMHEGNNPIPEELQKELLATMPALAEHQYFIFRNREQQIIEFKEFVESCDIDEFISQLPAKMRKEIETSQPNPTPEIAEPLLKYIEQLQVYLPQDERFRYNLMQKLQHPPKPKIDDEYWYLYKHSHINNYYNVY